MELIYNNSYGTTYKVDNHANPLYNIQLVINNIGIFMTAKELNALLKLVRLSYGNDDACNCEQCKGQKLNKLWKTNPYIDLCLKVNDSVLDFLEDLILGTQFTLNLDVVLEEHRIK